MMRRHLPGVLLSLVLPLSTATAQDRPNVVLLITDQHHDLLIGIGLQLQANVVGLNRQLAMTPID